MASIVFAGKIRCSALRFEAAQARPLLELFFEGADGVSFMPKHITAKEMFSGDERHSMNRFAEGVWTFSCELHDDDWWNTDREFLVDALRDVKDGPGEDVLFACDARGQLDSAWIVSASAARVVEPLPTLPDDAGNLVSNARVDELIAAVEKILK